MTAKRETKLTTEEIDTYCILKYDMRGYDAWFESLLGNVKMPFTNEEIQMILEAEKERRAKLRNESEKTR